MNFRFAWTFTLVLVITGGFLAGMAYMGNSHRNLPQPQPETGGTPKSPSTQVSKQTQYGQAVEQSTTVPPASLIKSDAPKVHQDQGNTNTSAQKEATYAGFLVIIGVFAVVVAGLQYCATKSAADAARASAKAALLALEAEKPYVFAEEPRIETLTARVPALTFSFPPQFAMVAQQWLMFRLNNRGKGVAIIESIWIRAGIVGRDDGRFTRNTTRTEKLQIRQRIIGAVSKAEIDAMILIPNTIAPPPIDRPFERFAFVAFIRYRDVFKRRYKSTFGYYYSSGGLLGAPDVFYSAGDKHNRVSEEN